VPNHHSSHGHRTTHRRPDRTLTERTELNLLVCCNPVQKNFLQTLQPEFRMLRETMTEDQALND
jgi:hypothetical protein